MPDPIAKEVKNLEKPSKEVQSTNIGAAYYLKFSDIPNANRVAELIYSDAVANNKRVPSTNPNAKIMVPYAEARYKAIDALLKKSGVKQVVEFAGGLTPRGMNNPQWNYVHTDQDEGSLRLISSITSQVLPAGRENMPHFVKFDAITGEGIDYVMSHLRNEPVGITHVGLFRYYPNELKEKTAKLAKRFLEKYGGVYITPDIHTWQRMEIFKRIDPDAEKRWESSSEIMGRDLASFRFKDNNEAINLFGKKLGFKIETYKFGDLVENISCVHALIKDPETAKRVEDTIKELEIWKMTLRD